MKIIKFMITLIVISSLVGCEYEEEVVNQTLVSKVNVK